MPKRLFIVDAMAMAYRSYHALSAHQLKTSYGQPTSAIMGSAMFLSKLIENEKPDYLIIASDSKEKTFRHEIYDQYKANRKPMPEDLALQINLIYQLFKELNLPVLVQPGLEADDLIGSVVKQVPQEIEKFIVSGDKDFLQLLDENTFLYTPKKGGQIEIRGLEELEKKYSGINPDQFIDILALWGDSADNVPGVPGIGEKGATKLISEYGSIEGIYKNISDIRAPKLKKKLLDNEGSARTSRQLVTIKTDVNLQLDLSSLMFQKASSSDSLYKFYQKLELKGLADRLNSNTSKPPEEAQKAKQTTDLKEISGKEHYKTVTNKESLKELLAALKLASTFSFDTETTGLDILLDHPIGLSFATEKNRAWYVPLSDSFLEDITPDEILATIKPHLMNKNKLKVGHNLKFDIQMLENIGVKVTQPLADTMIASHLADPDQKSFSLDHSCAYWLEYKKIPTSSLMGAKKDISMIKVPLNEITQYACEDADLSLQLFEKLDLRLAQLDLKSTFKEVEMPLVPILATMEKQGIHIDAAALQGLSEKIATRLADLEQAIYDEGGEEFNINSPAQLRKILFEKLAIHDQLGITKIKKTKSGLSTDVSVLEKLSAHPLAQFLLEYRSLSKLKNTYTDTLPKLINPKSQRLHTHFHQTGTATGRLSSSQPNLQNIPIKSELGKEIRRSFQAKSHDYLIISADYSQVELRMLAHLANESGLQKAFLNNEDIHCSTASKIFDIAKDKVSQEQRSRAKAINFGLIYGMGPQRLARDTGVKTNEAKEFIQNYFKSYPNIKNYIQSNIEFAKQNLYVTTLMGRRRPLNQINATNRLIANNAEHMAVNSPIQGSAADLIKIAMINIQNSIENSQIRAKMLLQVHDELIFECHREDANELKQLIKQSMEQALTLSVPLEVDIGDGVNWLEAH